MGYDSKLKPPVSLRIDYAPSSKQYEVWKSLQPECPYCGGEIIQQIHGVDLKGQPTYHPICKHCGTTNIPQFILMGGAAGGGKSYTMASWVISSCMRWSDIKMAIARKTLKSLKGSTFNTVKMLMKKWGLKQDVHYKINNLEGIVTFWNDSQIILLEMADLPSDPDFNRFGSMEITGAAVDEVSEISERACEVLFSRVRYNVHNTFKVPKMVMSTNPCLGWVRDRFVQDEEGNPIECKEGEQYIPFTVDDNPDAGFRSTYMAALDKISDPAVKARLRYGNWDFVESNEAAAYWNFDGNKHLVTGLKEKAYNPLKPIILSWDFNVIPHMSVLAFQLDYENKKIYILEELLGKPKSKNNNTPQLARDIANKYLLENHMGGLVITGDPAGRARSTQTEDGVNNFTIITNEMKNTNLKPTTKLLNKQPPLAVRLEFVNSVFTGYDGWQILIDMRCRKLTEDLIYQKKNQDGTKNKKMVTDPSTKVKYEKYGHLSDSLDYVLCLFLNDSWTRFRNRHRTILETTEASVYGVFDFF